MNTPTAQDLITRAVASHPELEPRALKALDILESAQVFSHPFHQHCRLVASSSSPKTAYVVDITARTCTCPDFRRNHPPHGLCKHLIAALAQHRAFRLAMDARIAAHAA